MRIDLVMVKTHEDLFFGKVNFGNKIYANQKLNRNGTKVEIYYETEGTGKWTKEEKVVIECGNNIAVLDTVAHREFLNPVMAAATRVTDSLVNSVHPTPVIKAQASGPGAGLKFSAQVETPHQKVQGVPG